MEKRQFTYNNFSYFTRWEGNAGSEQYFVYLIHNPTECVFAVTDTVREAKQIAKEFNATWREVDYTTTSLVGNSLRDDFYVKGTLESYMLEIPRNDIHPLWIRRFTFSGKAIEFIQDGFIMNRWVFIKEDNMEEPNNA
jgi:hypothetical protein